jgi:broad specificity phosphatase PhoE
MSDNQLWTKRVAISATVLALLALISVALIYWTHSTTVVLVVRHAERNNAASCSPPELGPPLSAAGQNRAQTLAHVCRDAGVAGVYASKFCRTQQTVAPLASQLGLTVKVVDQLAPDKTVNVDSLIAQVWANNTGQVVVIAGHTNTVPVIIEKLGGGTIAPIPETEFDNLFVITISRWRWWGSRTRTVRLKYGVPT